ncbi:Uma2 family endonuclease [Phytomonospora sp. NPDC050363]|uniref:Uma2 family endonuclease n=1 Tax=Phytomonospora sp. NPDC050363 TaxID=3155642 RepID=UPI0033CFBBD4
MTAVSRQSVGTGWDAALSHGGPWTESDFNALPDGLRAELHYGRLILTPSATFGHGNVIRRICAMFDLFVDDPDQVGQQTDVRLADGQVYFCPDFLVLREPGEGRPIAAASVFIVGEVRSPGGGKEYTEKMSEYAAAGIPGYLIIRGTKAQGYSAQYYLLRDGRYELVEKTDPGAILTITEPMAATLNLSRL